MQTFVDRFYNATVAGFKDRALHYISTVAHLASLSRQRKVTRLYFDRGCSRNVILYCPPAPKLRKWLMRNYKLYFAWPYYFRSRSAVNNPYQNLVSTGVLVPIFARLL